MSTSCLVAEVDRSRHVPKKRRHICLRARGLPSVGNRVSEGVGGCRIAAAKPCEGAVPRVGLSKGSSTSKGSRSVERASDRGSRWPFTRTSTDVISVAVEAAPSVVTAVVTGCERRVAGSARTSMRNSTTPALAGRRSADRAVKRGTHCGADESRATRSQHGTMGARSRRENGIHRSHASLVRTTGKPGGADLDLTDFEPTFTGGRTRRVERVLGARQRGRSLGCASTCSRETVAARYDGRRFGRAAFGL